MDATVVSTAGPLKRLAARECERLEHQYACFRESWDRRDLGRAVVNFERFSRALQDHVKWEEETLLGEFERRCRRVEQPELLRHRRQHQVSGLLSERVARLLAARMGIGADVDDELVVAIHELESVICSHRQSELDEVRTRLDAILSDVELHELEDRYEHELQPAPGK